MTYSKPEVAVLGDAARIIQQGGKTGSVPDGIGLAAPAYDLDE